MNHDSYDNSYISDILNKVKTVAIVGASANDVRPSFFVALRARCAAKRLSPCQATVRPLSAESRRSAVRVGARGWRLRAFAPS